MRAEQKAALRLLAEFAIERINEIGQHASPHEARELSIARMVADYML